jgi:Cof subfamily protein (haloacid dehalogenase superfamily)
MTEQTKIEKKDIKLIAIDLDGTLLNSKSQVSPRTEAAIKEAAAAGAQVVIATGKTWPAVAGLVQKLGITSPAICMQGLITYSGDGKIMHESKLDPTLARQVITFSEDRGFFMIGYNGTHIYFRRENKQVEEALLLKYHEPAAEIVGALQNMADEPGFNKVIAVGEPRSIKALRWQLSMQIGGAGRLMQAGVPQMVEILPPGASKGTALKQLLKDLRIAPENVMALGDAENDLEMLQLAGVGVLMGQADPNLREHADYVTADHDHDGVAEAIDRFMFGRVPAPAEVEKPAEAKPETVAEKADAPPAAESKEGSAS